MIDGFSIMPLSKNRSFKMPITHSDRTEVIRYTTLNFTSEAEDIDNDRQERILQLVLVKTSTPIFRDGVTQVEQGKACNIQSLVLVTQVLDNSSHSW